MIRIANCSGFYGDRLAAAREMVEGGPIDVLTGDYLAELTMLILARSEEGYAKTFLRQMEDVLGACVERGIKIVANAGGLNPAGLAERVRALGTGATVAHVEGDDLRDRFPGALTANAYLGGVGNRRGAHAAAPTSSSPGASRTRRSSSPPPPGGSAGVPTSGTRSPAPSPPATCSSAARTRRAATTPSSARCPVSRTRASRSRRCTRTGAR